MALHQSMSQRCKRYQEAASMTTPGRAKPERQNCPKCGRDINGNLWSLWQHFLSLHPDNLDLLRNDVPRSWYENVMKGSRRTRTPGPVRGERTPAPPMHAKKEPTRSPSRVFPPMSPPPRPSRLRTEPKHETHLRSRSRAKTEPKHDTHLRSRSRAKTEPKHDTDLRSRSRVRTEPKHDTHLQSRSRVRTEPKHESHLRSHSRRRTAPKHETDVRSRSRHRRERRKRHHHQSKRSHRDDSRSPPPDPAHKPLPDKGPDPPGPSPGGSGILGSGGSGAGVANLLIHIGQALAAERQQQ